MIVINVIIPLIYVDQKKAWEQKHLQAYQASILRPIDSSNVSSTFLPLRLWTIKKCQQLRVILQN